MQDHEPLDYFKSPQQSTTKWHPAVNAVYYVVMILVPGIMGTGLLISSFQNAYTLFLFVPMMISLITYHSSRIQQQIDYQHRILLTFGISIGLLFCLFIFGLFAYLSYFLFLEHRRNITSDGLIPFAIASLLATCPAIAIIFCSLELKRLWQK